MKLNRKLIRVFEHQTLRLNQEIDGITFEKPDLEALQRFYGDKGVAYYSLVHNGVRFNEHVGVIQVGSTMIEVLPKMDNKQAESQDKALEKNTWQKFLIDMLFAVGLFQVHSPSSSSLKLKNNAILDLYFAIFIKEVEYLQRTGLIKQYRKKEGNVFSLKGNIKFNQQIQQNLVHKERFYTTHSSYDVQHSLHYILYQAICLLKQINTNIDLHGRIGALLLNFPEMPSVKISEATFAKINYTKKNQHYKKAIEIARLILLHYHPDLVHGKNNVLALMFDMNKLWEKFVYISLRNHIKHPSTITAQTSKYFWKNTKTGSKSKIIPDIVINLGKEDCFVLDTKWKNLNGYNPSPEDLRQMYVYHEYYQAKKVALVYPGHKHNAINGKYLSTDYKCSVISLGIGTSLDIKNWQKEIFAYLSSFASDSMPNSPLI